MHLAKPAEPFDLVKLVAKLSRTGSAGIAV